LETEGEPCKGSIMMLAMGTSSVIARHDYLPFGEEIGANVGMRTGAQSYNAPDSNRQKYAMLERDSTGLDQYLVAGV